MVLQALNQTAPYSLDRSRGGGGGGGVLQGVKDLN